MGRTTSIATAGAVLAACCIATVALAASGAAAEPPRRTDPLSAEERAIALDRARRAPSSAARDAGRSVTPAAPTRDATREEVLRIETRRRSKSERAAGMGRGADVYLYDYGANVTRHTVVELPSGRVEREDVLEGVQLPLTPAEVDRATEIALADATVRDRIQRLFRQRTGEVLEDVDQLHSKAMVFSAESMPDAVNQASSACGLHRCAQLLLFTRDHVTVEVIPIVDLSTGRLVQVLDF